MMKRTLLALAVVLGLSGFVLAEGVASAASLVDMATLWDGFAAAAGEMFGPAINPATLSWNDEYALRVQYASPMSPSAPRSTVYLYVEPDEGLGAGQLGYIAAAAGDGEKREYIYSAAWRDGGASYGVSVRHVAQASASSPGKAEGWAVDLGFSSRWTSRLGVGVVVRNLAIMGSAPRSAMPVEVVAGFAVHLGRGLLFAVDYAARDLEHGSAEYRFGLEGSLGPVVARIGQRSSPAHQPLFYVGLGFLLEPVRLDATYGQRADERVLLLGLAFYF